MRVRSHEEWLAELDDIVRRFRHGESGDPKTRVPDRLTRDEAIERLEKLGLTRGQAIRLLRPEQPLPTVNYRVVTRPRRSR